MKAIGLDPMFALVIAVILLAGPGLSRSAWAEPPELDLVLQNHKFTPDHLELAQGEKYVLVVKNLDPTPEEFESADLNREKVVKGKGDIRVFVGPLEPGTYNFMGEYNPQTAKGVITVK